MHSWIHRSVETLLLMVGTCVIIESCTPDGYTKVDATHFIKVIGSSLNPDEHKAIIEAQSNAAVTGRLAFLDTQAKDNLTRSLMAAQGIDGVAIGMRCATSCNSMTNWAWQQGDDLEAVGWLPADAMVTGNGPTPKCAWVLTSFGWQNTKCDQGVNGAVYELVVETDMCSPNPCSAVEDCVPAECTGSGTYECVPSNRTTTPAAVTTSNSTSTSNTSTTIATITTTSTTATTSTSGTPATTSPRATTSTSSTPATTSTTITISYSRTPTTTATTSGTTTSAATVNTSNTASIPAATSNTTDLNLTPRAGSCSPDGYTKVDATHFIKVVGSSLNPDEHKAIIEAESNAAVTGRLAFLDTQAKDDLTRSLMVAQGIDGVAIGMRCATSCNSMANWAWQQDDVLEAVGWLPADAMVTGNGPTPKCAWVLTSFGWQNTRCNQGVNGAVYELVVETDTCSPNPCSAVEDCVPAECTASGTYDCVPSNRTTTAAAVTSSTSTTPLTTSTTPTTLSTTSIAATTTTSTSTPTAITSTTTTIPQYHKTSAMTTATNSISATPSIVQRRPSPIHYKCHKNVRRNATVSMTLSTGGDARASITSCSMLCFQRRPQCVAFNIVTIRSILRCQLFAKTSTGNDMLDSVESVYCVCTYGICFG